MIDFAPEKSAREIKQKEYSNNKELIKNILGGDYISPGRLMAEFGKDFLDRKKLKEKVFEKYPKVAIVYGAINSFANHGELVASSMSQIWRGFGFRSEPHTKLSFCLQVLYTV